MTISALDREILLKRATCSAMVVACFLIVLKLYAWISTGSISLQATLMDSVLDAFASLVNLLAVRHSLKPADNEHRFGHGKIEALAGLGQAAFIGGSALLIVMEAGRRLFNPTPLPNFTISVWVIVVSIVATFGLVCYQKHVIRLTNSPAVAADATHYQSDLLINLGVLMSLVLSGWFDMERIDPLFGAAIAVYIFWTAYKVLRASLDILMDRELPDEDRALIMGLASTHPQVKGIHDLRTRSTGSQLFIQFHLELDGALSLLEAHSIAHEVEAKLKEKYPTAEVLIHQEILPCTHSS